jgi:hypothetical protein
MVEVVGGALDKDNPDGKSKMINIIHPMALATWNASPVQ